MTSHFKFCSRFLSIFIMQLGLTQSCTETPESIYHKIVFYDNWIVLNVSMSEKKTLCYPNHNFVKLSFFHSFNSWKLTGCQEWHWVIFLNTKTRRLLDICMQIFSRKRITSMSGGPLLVPREETADTYLKFILSKFFCTSPWEKYINKHYKLMPSTEFVCKCPFLLNMLHCESESCSACVFCFHWGLGFEQWIVTWWVYRLSFVCCSVVQAGLATLTVLYETAHTLRALG